MTTNLELPENDWHRKVYGRGGGQGADKRRKPRKADQDRLRATQNNHCLYCELPLGIRIWRGPLIVVLTESWDHFVPYSYVANNPEANWVLACQICNSAKAERMFPTVEAAREAVLRIRRIQGFEAPAAVRQRIEQGHDADLWPIHKRITRSEISHYLRPDGDAFETACGRAAPAEELREPIRHRRMCLRCVARRDLDNNPLGP